MRNFLQRQVDQGTMSDFRIYIVEQSDAIRWFGAGCFRRGDAYDLDFISGLSKKAGVFLNLYSPECNAYCPLGRGAFGRGASKSPALFAMQVELLDIVFQALGVPYAVETTLGGKEFTDSFCTTVIRAMDLGLHSEDAHFPDVCLYLMLFGMRCNA